MPTTLISGSLQKSPLITVPEQCFLWMTADVLLPFSLAVPVRRPGLLPHSDCGFPSPETSYLSFWLQGGQGYTYTAKCIPVPSCLTEWIRTQQEYPGVSTLFQVDTVGHYAQTVLSRPRTSQSCWEVINEDTDLGWAPESDYPAEKQPHVHECLGVSVSSFLVTAGQIDQTREAFSKRKWKSQQ